MGQSQTGDICRSKGHKMTVNGAGPSPASGHQQGVGASIAPGHQQNAAPSSTTQPSLQNVKPGNLASPAGTSTLTRKIPYDPNKEGKALVRWAINESKREPGASLPTKLADAFRDADSDVRKAMRGDRVYKKFVLEWASKLVTDAWNAPRTTIHHGDQVMRELHRVATGLPRELAADLVVAAAPRFVECSKYAVRRDKEKPAIFSSNDKVVASKPSPEPNPDVEASKVAPDVEASQANPDVEASMPSSDPEASMLKYADYTYFGDLKAWIAGAEVPNPKQDDAIGQLEGLVDKSYVGRP
jgi:hypothetical protein